MTPPDVLETDRLMLRRLTTDDAPFVHALVNDAAWLRYIGDKGVRTLEDAAAYIRQGPMRMYERHGFGLMLTALKQDATPIGICGLIKRDTLEDIDIGLAFLPPFRRHGYAYESASAVLQYGQNTFGLKRIVAITSPDNEASIRILERLGFRFEQSLQMTEDGLPTSLYARTF